MSNVQNLFCVEVRTLPNVDVFWVNLVVPEGLDTPKIPVLKPYRVSCEPSRS